MPKKYYIILILAVYFGFLCLAQPAEAGVVWFSGKDISVDFNDLPFQMNNWAPGMSDTKTITIQNSENFNTNVYFKAKKTSGGDDILGNALTITIGNQSKHLSDLFSNNLSLDSINAGQSKSYNITINFDQDAGNEYQNRTINFDFIITVEEIGGNGGGSITIPGGGGGGGLPPGLTIRGERELLIDCCGPKPSVTISWNTNYKATSQVIYSTLPNQFDLSEGPNYYGYDYYVEGDDKGSDKYLNHDVTLTGLTEGVTYYYRCISHASPATIGKEHSFTIVCSETDTGDGTGGSEDERQGEEQTNGGGGIISYLPTTSESGPEPSPGSAPITKGESSTGENLIKEAITQEERPSFLAAVGDLFSGFTDRCFSYLPWWLIFILAALCALMGALRYKKKTKQALKWFILAALLVLVAFIAWFIFGHCVSVRILILITLLTFVVWRLLIYEKKRDNFQFGQGKRVNFLKDKVFILGLIIFLILFILLAILGCLYIWIIITAILIYLLGVLIVFKKQN